MFDALWTAESASSTLAVLFGLALKTGLLLALACLAALALRRAPARTRHTLWAAALAATLALPALTPLVPSWRVAWLPELASPLLPALEETAPETAAERRAGTAPVAGGRTVSSAITTPAPPSHRATSLASGESDEAASVSVSRRIPSPALLAVALWLTGTFVVLGRLLFGLTRARRLSRGGPVPDASWVETLERQRRRLGVTRPVRLSVSSDVASPMTWGFFRPRVLLPAAGAAWSAERLKVVLQHELVHIRRADWLGRMLARLACAVYWFNPLVWFAARRLELEQEVACDDEVLRLGTRASTYARHLLAIARSIPPGRSLVPALELAPQNPKARTSMEARLMSILSPDRRHKTARSVLLPLLLVVVTLVPALAAVQPMPGTATTQTDPAAVTPTAPAGGPGLRETIREIAELEDQLEPYEEELETLERELEPYEEELEAMEEAELEPYEQELDSVESELEPYEARLDAIETELRPYEERLREIESGLDPYEDQLDLVEDELEPYEDRLAAMETELAPFEPQLDALEDELEPLEDQLDELEEQLQETARADTTRRDELHRLMSDLHEQMRPIHERMSAVHQEMRPVFDRMEELHAQMEPIHERMGEIHARMAPVHEVMEAVHKEMRPVFERMEAIHREMEPVHRKLEEHHERMRPHYDRMEAFHESMRPVHEKMAAVHERMIPIHEELQVHHERLHAELRGVVENQLRAELSAVLAADAPFAAATDAVLHDVGIRVDGGTLRLHASLSQVREILAETLKTHRVGSPTAFDEAIAAAALAIVDLEIETK